MIQCDAFDQYRYIYSIRYFIILTVVFGIRYRYRYPLKKKLVKKWLFLDPEGVTDEACRMFLISWCDFSAGNVSIITYI